MSYHVDEGRSENRIAEEFCKSGKLQVRTDYQTGPFRPFRYDLKQGFRLLLREAEVGKIVKNEQVRFGKLPLQPCQRVVLPGLTLF